MALIRTYTIEYIIDDSRATSALQRINSQLRLLQSQFQQATTSATALNTAVTNLAPSLNAVQVNATKAATSVADAKTSFAGLMGQMVAAQAVFAGISKLGELWVGVADGIQAARDKTQKLAEEFAKFRAGEREVAAILGERGPTNKVTGKTIEMALASQSTPEEISSFRAYFEGSAAALKTKIGPPGADARMKEDITNQIAAVGVSYAKSIGLPFKEAADLTAMVGSFAPISNADDALYELTKVGGILSTSRGAIAPLVNSLVKAAGPMVGENRSLSDIHKEAAMMSALSNVYSSASLATYLKKAGTEMQTFKGVQGKSLTAMGITEGMDLDKSLPLLQKELDKRLAIDKQEPHIAMQKMGFSDQTGAAVLTVLARFNEQATQALDKAGTVTKESARADLTASQRGTFQGIGEMVESQAASTTKLKGMKHQAIDLLTQEATTRMQRAGTFTNTAIAVHDIISSAGGFAQLLGQAPEEAKRVNWQAMELLRQTAAETGNERMFLDALAEEMGLQTPGQPLWGKKDLAFATGVPLGTQTAFGEIPGSAYSKAVDARSTLAQKFAPEADAAALGKILYNPAIIKEARAASEAGGVGPPKVAGRPPLSATKGFKVIRVVDGDTIDVELNGQVERVRLSGINATEVGHDFWDVSEKLGGPATEWLSQELLGKTIDLMPDTGQTSYDPFERRRGYAISGGFDIGRKMISAGMARHTPQFPHARRGEYATMQMIRDQQTLSEISLPDFTPGGAAVAAVRWYLNGMKAGEAPPVALPGPVVPAR